MEKEQLAQLKKEEARLLGRDENEQL